MWSFRILLFLLCVNVVAAFALNAQTGGQYLFPGVGYAHPLNSTGDADSYEENFNSSGLVEQWDPQGGYGFAGDLYSGLNMFWTMFRFLFDGVGMTLEWCGSFIPVAQTSFSYIAWMLRTLTAAVAVVFVVQMITGRDVESA
jgi:hypothetical protein